MAEIGVDAERNDCNAETRCRRDKSLTDAELEKHLDYTLNASVQEAELEKTYYNKCRGLLPLHKLVRLPFACKDFARDFFSKHRKGLPPQGKDAAQPKPSAHPKM